MKLSEMRALLAERNIQLTKSLGQNFLFDANQLRRITALAELGPQDKVLEIGPGLGPLTELLVEQAGKVLAIEKDERLVRILEERFRAAAAKLDLLHADALEYLKGEPRDWRDWKLVSNLPYSVASPILVELAQGARGPRLMVATLQIEVARRLLATPAEPDYGVLTVLVQLDYEPRDLFKVPASCFFPEPDVDSAFVRLVRRPQPLLDTGLRWVFTRIVKRSFSQRRKMMFKLLRQDWEAEALEAAFDSLGLSRQVRAETVGVEQFVALSIALAEKK